MEEKDPNLAAPPLDERRDDDLPPPARLPKWVPILIGAILVMMAAAALWTGLKYRNEAFRRPVGDLPKRSLPPSGVGAPGEPTPGASRVAHGPAGDTIPTPDPVPPGETSKYTISNTGGTITATTRITASRGMLLDIKPPTALVYVNDSAIGEARQFSRPDSLYEFAEQGNYTVRIVEEGFTELEYVITSAQNAKTEVAVIQAQLQKKR